MDKNAIKKYAVWARRELISRVSQKALQYGISEADCGDATADTINGHLLTATEKNQRQSLINKIKKDGYQQVMEEAAYTWFNRFCALRYMEVNGYLPTRVRVFTDEQNNFKPQIIAEAIHLELDGLDMEKVYALKEENKTDELYKYLLITQCNALSAILPGMFQKIADYTELLFPDNLLREGSAIEQMIALIPEEDWTDQVQIIGWLYQYYNTEPKDKVFADLKKNIKISKENIPAATQLFTPDWIVHYMVENSLGRLWVEGHPNDEMKASWKYYLEEAEQEPDVQEQLESIRAEYAQLKPEDIRVIDPCMGSGHILVVMFDVLVQIYEAYGYSAREAASMIVEHNLWGLDIDERAAQLSYFAVMMKARQYDRRFFSRKVQPHVYAIVESNDIDAFTLEYFINGDANLKKSMSILMDELRDAKEYGSILNVTMVDFPALYARLSEVEDDISMHRESALNTIKPLIQVAEALAQKYSVTCTNPPYMGSSNMNPKLNEFIKNKYADYKSDFFSAFVVRASEMTTSNGYCGFFTPYVWMFIQSYEKLRQYLYNQATIETLIQFEYSAFEEATVPVCTFAFSNSYVAGKKGNYLRLVDFRGGMEVQRQKTLEASADHNCGYYYEQTTDNFSKIPGSPVAYWVSEAVYKTFQEAKLDDYSTPKAGLSTGDNDRFLRLFWEVNVCRIYFNGHCRDDLKKLLPGKKWIPMAKGGNFRRWYGNNEYVLNFENDGEELKYWLEHNPRDPKTKSYSRYIRNYSMYLQNGFSFNDVSSGKTAFRYQPCGYIPNARGPFVYSDDMNLFSYLNSAVCLYFLNIIAPTLTYNVGDVTRIPYRLTNREDISILARNNISLSRTDWDSYETSWDFKQHPLV